MKKLRKLQPVNHKEAHNKPQRGTELFLVYLALLCAFLWQNPFFAVGVDFFLPDRNGAFEFANGPFAGLERRLPVWGADADHDARFADLEFAGAVADAD